MVDNNSIRTNLNSNSAENEIRLLLSEPKNKNKTIVLLEGEDDIQLFTKLLNRERIFLCESYSGKCGVKDILRKFTGEYRVIGIIDRDYLMENVPKLFYCDYCNAEMMIVSNDGCFDDTLFQLKTGISNSIELRTNVLNKLFYFSIIRKLNEEKDWGICFEKVPIVNIINNFDDLQKIIEIVNYKNSLNKIDDNKILIIKNEVEGLRGQNLLNYTNGHDFFKGLAVELRKLFPNSKIKNIGYDQLACLVRTGYTMDCFKMTCLYNELLKFQFDYKLEIVFYK